jgi:hypothetical protein
MPIVTEVATRLGKVLARNARSESTASAAEMAGTKTPAQAGPAEAADTSAATEAAPVAAAEAAHMRAATEAAPVAATEAAAVAPTSSAAARERINGQSRAERGSRRQDDHGLT